MLTSTPVADTYMYSGPLETLAAMSGGGTFRAEVNAEGVFERLGRELSGYYRIGIEKDPGDADGKGRRMKVQVARDSVTVRAREIFDVPVYEDRDWAARFAAAIDGPVLATELGLRVTSYLSADPDNPERRRLLLTGEASRVQAGEATLHLVVNDLAGKKVAAGEVKLPHGGGERAAVLHERGRPPRDLHRASGDHGRRRAGRLGRSPRRGQGCHDGRPHRDRSDPGARS